MWRKEQHFVTIQKDVGTAPTLNNSGWYRTGSLCDKKTTTRSGPSIQESWFPRRGPVTTGDGHTLYQGHEFDIFSNEPIIHTNPDDDPCTSRASTRLSIINHEDQHYGHAHHHHYHPHFQHHQSCPSLNNNKRKVEEDIPLCDKETGNHKHCRLEKNPATPPRSSVLGTHFFLHTTPRGAPIDLFKPNDDNSSNCFCTQHVIYS